MNNAVFERFRQSWENLNDRERRLLGLLGLVFAAGLLLVPPIVLHLQNTDIATENEELRGVLQRLSEQRARLSHLKADRIEADKLYAKKTPALGSFLEVKAKEQGVTLQEVTDQPEKINGRYLRRSVTVSLPQVGLTPVINLLSSIVTSGHPVAIDRVQIDHYQPGDQYNVKIGVLTYDKQGPVAKTKADGSATGDEATE